MWPRKKRTIIAVRSRATCKNISSLLDRIKLTGQTPQSWQALWEQMPHTVMKTTNEVFHEVPSFLADLSAACFIHDARKLRQVLQEMQRVICQPNRLNAKRALFACGGVDVLLTILFTDSPWLRQSPWVGPIWNTSLKLLKELSQSLGPRVPLYMVAREQDSLLPRLFSMLHYKTTFESAANVTEDVLSTTSTLVDARAEFPDLTQLMSRLSVKHRALFCRVLALFIYSPHSAPSAHRGHAIKPPPRPAGEVDSIIEHNQSLLIDDPQLLGKVVNLLKYQINVIDSLQYGNFLALLISINDEVTPGAAIGSATAPTAATGSTLTNPNLPAAAPISSLFSSTISPQGVTPNLTDILLAGGFPLGGVYEMGPSPLPPPYPDDSEGSHPSGSQTGQLPNPSIAGATMGSSPPAVSLAASPQPSSPATPSAPSHQVGSVAGMGGPQSDGSEGSWPASMDWLDSSLTLSATGTTMPPPDPLEHPDHWGAPTPIPRRPSPPPSDGPDAEDSGPHFAVPPPILSTLITASSLGRPAPSSAPRPPPLSAPEPLPAPSWSYPEEGRRDPGFDYGAATTPHWQGDGESPSEGWLASMTTPLLSDVDRRGEEAEEGNGHTQDLMDADSGGLSLQLPPPPGEASAHASPTLAIGTTTPQAAPPPQASPGFSTHRTTGHAGVATTNVLARTSLLEYGEGSAGDDDDAAGNTRRLSLQSLTVVSCQVEVLFVLSALLSGKRKIEVRERLTDLRLLGVLHDVFDYVFWEKKRDTQQFSQSLASAIASALGGPADAGGLDSVSAFGLPGPSVGIGGTATGGPPVPVPEPQPIPLQQHPFNASHPADCDCRPEAARRIQYLRLIHKYCDCADYHHLHKADPETRESKRKLARKLVGCLLRHKSDTNCRYWLASCLEAILRGNHWLHRREDQFQVAGNDLLPHLLNDVVHCLEGGHSTTRLQSSFDLLAELLKFNRELFHALNDLLRADPDLHRRLGQVVARQLVHSNVFLRAVVLSLHYFHPRSLLHACHGAGRPNDRPMRPCDLEDMQGRIQVAKDAVRAALAAEGRVIPTSPLPLRPHSPPSPTVCPSAPPLCAPHPAPPLFGSPTGSHYSHPTAPTANSCPVDQCPECGEGSRDEAPYDFQHCLVTRFVEENQILLVRNLMVEIRLDQINKENICCINTALVFFLFAQDAGCLSRLLSAIRHHEESRARERRQAGGPTAPGDAMATGDDAEDGGADVLGRRDPFRNFHKLMRYWIVYYDGRTHDTETIFHSSRIPWDKWWGTVVALLDLLPKFFLDSAAPPDAMQED